MLIAMLAATALESRTTVTPPAPAAAVGYTTETFGPKIAVGRNWHKFTFFKVDPSRISVQQNPDGSVTIHPGGNDYGAQLSTASVGTKPGKFQGIAFGGGGYFQVTMAFDGPASFWANDIETMNSVSLGKGPHQWPGQPKGYGDWVEPDLAEFDSPGVYGFGIHNWYGRLGKAGDANTANYGSPASPAGADYTKPNTYGFLWVPATATSQGYAKYYFNGVQIGRTVMWKLYDPTAKPVPSTSDGSAFSVLDTLHLALILGVGTTTPSTVYNVQVWQKSAAKNISTLPARTEHRMAVRPQSQARRHP
jgi:hypothetical protein